MPFPFLPACASCGFWTLTLGRVSSGVEGDSEGLVPRVAAVGRVAWVDVEENTTETQLRQQGELQDRLGKLVRTEHIYSWQHIKKYGRHSLKNVFEI